MKINFRKKAQDIIANKILIEDIHHARVEEIEADTYAKEMLTQLYGSVQAGINTLNKLDETKKWSFPYTSKHQPKEDRIKLLKEEKQQNVNIT